MTEKNDRERWNERYVEVECRYGDEPVEFLRSHVHLLPLGSRVLDLTTGEGRNALFLAQQGFRVTGIDISNVALNRARQSAEKLGANISLVQADLKSYPLPVEAFDVVMNFYFLERALLPDMKRAVRHGGLIIFESYTVDQQNLKDAHRLPREYLLEHNELLREFLDFRVFVYRELTIQNKAIASLIARRP